MRRPRFPALLITFTLLLLCAASCYLHLLNHIPWDLAESSYTYMHTMPKEEVNMHDASAKDEGSYGNAKMKCHVMLQPV